MTEQVKRKRGRPPKKKTLEQEAQEFLEKEKSVQNISKVTSSDLGDYYAGCALSGLIASGKFMRSEEIVEEAFSYSRRMLEHKKET